MTVLDRMVFDGGVMGELVKTHDWSTHSLGDPEHWSPVLVNAITMCLATPTPVQLLWGSSYTLIYNDASVPFFGTTHPALALSAPDAWGERWSTIREAVERVRTERSTVELDHLRLQPLLDTDGSVGGVLCITKVERKTATPERETRDELLALVGHELRNPLSAVSTSVQSLLMRSPAPEVLTMARAVDHLSRLVEELLELSRVSSGRLVLQRKPIELAQIIDRAVEIASSELEPQRKRAAVSVPRVGWQVHADPERLARALGHVIINAAQHSDPGAAIMIECERAGDQIVLRVVDKGRGIARDRLSSIFDVHRPSSTEPKRSRGLGVGLAIVRGVVELHGGTIEIRSDGVDHGVTCLFTLPASRATVSQPATISSIESRKRLLLVEDNDDAARALKLALEHLGYEVALAHDGPIALNLARTFQPHVALLDLGLPVMDGWELARRLRNSKHEMAIVAVTAKDEDADRAQSEQLGFAEHLVKPIDLNRLKRLVDSLAKPSSSR